MLAAEEDLANKVAEIAAKRGLTVYQTVNDILEQALRAEESGLNIREALNEHDSMQRARELGLTFTVEHLYYQVVESAYGGSRDKIRDLYRDMGFWYGKYFKTRSDDPLKALNDALTYLTVGSQLTVEKGRGEELTVNLVSEKFSRGYTEVFATFLEAAYGVLGYTAKSSDNGRGMIRIRFERGK